MLLEAKTEDKDNISHQENQLPHTQASMLNRQILQQCRCSKVG